MDFMDLMERYNQTWEGVMMSMSITETQDDWDE